jgi:hypothetical protein
MNKFFAHVLIAAAVAVSAAAQAMPIASDRTQDSLLVRTDYRCGVGWYLGSDGLCRSNYYDRYYAPRYWGPYRGPVPCNGRGVHPNCSAFGACWLVCN